MTADRRAVLALALPSVVLVVAAWIVPADGEVTWSGVAAVSGLGALSCAVTCAWLLPRWSRLEPRPKARRALATSLAATVTIPLLWLLAIPFAVLATSGLLGRAAHRDGERTGGAAALIAVVGFFGAALLAMLGIADLLPEWPPRNWHGGGGA